MSKLTIYLEDTLEERLRQAAKDEGVSVSKLVARYVEAKTARTWPAGFLQLAGSCPDLSRPIMDPDIRRSAPTTT